MFLILAQSVATYAPIQKASLLEASLGITTIDIECHYRQTLAYPVTDPWGAYVASASRRVSKNLILVGDSLLDSSAVLMG